MSGEGVITWDELKRLVSNNDILHLRRHPDVMAKYNQSKQDLKELNKTVFSHLIINELQWAPPSVLDQVDDINNLPNVIKLVPLDPRLLGNAQDIKILLNDFPYYFEPDVMHWVVWTKVNIKSDPHSTLGDISLDTRAIIERYVQKTFIQWLQIPLSNVIWFRNWTALQSVRNISHIHVIVKNFPQEYIAKVQRQTGIPLLYDTEDNDLNVNEYLTESTNV